MKRMVIWMVVLSLIGGMSIKTPLQAESEESKFRPRVYLSETEAVQLQVEQSDHKTKIQQFTVDEETINTIRKQQRVKFFTDTYRIHKIYRSGEDEPYRYAVPLQQPGQHEYMDLMYGINADGTVHRIDLMVYREPYGGEVKSRRFMRQFKGEDLSSSEFRVNLDVIHISGATISSKAVARGTRKVLAILKHENYIP